MSKKKAEYRCIPLELTRSIFNSNDKFLNNVKRIIDASVTFDDVFQKTREVPEYRKRPADVRATYSQVSHGIQSLFNRKIDTSKFTDDSGDGFELMVSNLTCTSYACYNWMYHKQVYEFTSELTEALCNQADKDSTVPVDVLDSLPFNGIYIQAPIVPEYNGFFFIRDVTNSNGRERENHIIWINEEVNVNNTMITFETKKGATIADGVQKAVDHMKQIFSDSQMDFASKIRINETVNEIISNPAASPETVAKCMQHVIYICCQNSEKEFNSDQKKIYRAPKGHISNTRSEVARYDVGKQFAVQYRNMKKRLENDQEVKVVYTGKSTGHGTPKRTHMRSAHYSHYWTGKRDGSEERVLICKWIPPIIVNPDGSEDDGSSVMKTRVNRLK